MNTELLYVTPEQAATWLRQNTSNRPLRLSHVNTLRQSFERGEYVQTHQGIAFDEDGVLLDGQHRLMAISQMKSGRFPMLVSFNLPRKAAFQVIDATQAKRTVADVLAVTREVAEVARFLATINVGYSAVTPTLVAPYVDFCKSEVAALKGVSSATCRTWSSASVRAAAVIAMKTGNAEYVKSVYRALCANDFEAMPRVAYSVYRAAMGNRISTTTRFDMFARCLRMFNPANANNARVQIRDTATETAAAREILRGLIGDGK